MVFDRVLPRQTNKKNPADTTVEDCRVKGVLRNSSRFPRGVAPGEVGLRHIAVLCEDGTFADPGGSPGRDCASRAAVAAHRAAEFAATRELPVRAPAQRSRFHLLGKSAQQELVARGLGARRLNDAAVDPNLSAGRQVRECG